LIQGKKRGKKLANGLVLKAQKSWAGCEWGKNTEGKMIKNGKNCGREKNKKARISTMEKQESKETNRELNLGRELLVVYEVDIRDSYMSQAFSQRRVPAKRKKLQEPQERTTSITGSKVGGTPPTRGKEKRQT